MNTTRKGKIARLPKSIRHQLNRRLEDGQPGNQLVLWLNGLPEVRDTLELHFDARPINEQNLSDWKQGGYREWLQHQESCDLVQRLTEQAEDLEEDEEGRTISDRLATLLAVDLVRVSEALLKETPDPRERWQRLRELFQELGQLRRGDHQASRLRIEQDRWSREAHQLDREEKKREIEEISERVSAPFLAAFQARSLAPFFGGGDKGWEIATRMAEAEAGLEPGTLSGSKKSCPPAADPNQPDQPQSRPIKVNQGQSRPIKVNQGQSR